MKKSILCLCGLLFCINTANACEGGQVITGQYNNHSFCVSDKAMNWWSAHQWCRAQGYVLSTPDRACNYTISGRDYTWQDKQCINISARIFWLDYVNEEKKALAFVHGGCNYRDLNYYYEVKALCDMGN